MLHERLVGFAGSDVRGPALAVGARDHLERDPDRVEAEKDPFHLQPPRRVLVDRSMPTRVLQMSPYDLSEVGAGHGCDQLEDLLRGGFDVLAGVVVQEGQCLVSEVELDPEGGFHGRDARGGEILNMCRDGHACRGVVTNGVRM